MCAKKTGNTETQDTNVAASALETVAETDRVVLEPAVQTAPPVDKLTPSVSVLTVRAVSRQGFRRCGRLWSYEPVRVQVTDAATESDALCITEAEARCLMAEPNLSVTEDE